MDKKSPKYAVFLPESPATRHVFDSLVDARALKGSPGFRFKKCSTEEDVEAFYQDQVEGRPSKDGPSVSEPPMPFKEPTAPLLNRFRVYIEKKMNEKVDELVAENPRYILNSSADRPTILHGGARYNAAHIAAQCGNLHVLESVLSLVTRREFIAKTYGTDVEWEMKSAHMLDLFLNVPDKMANQTPLHFAAKAGHIHIIEKLLEFKQCEKAPLNRYDETPADLAARGMNKITDEERAVVASRIRELLVGEQFYIALFRLVVDTGRPQLAICTFRPDITEIDEAEFRRSISIRKDTVDGKPINFQYLVPDVDDSLQLSAIINDPFFSPICSSSPRIASPCSLNNTSPMNNFNQSGLTPSSMQGRRKAFRSYRMTCFVGPFTDEALVQRLYTDWQRTDRAFLFANPSSGYETAGRQLAEDANVPFINLTEEEHDQDVEDAKSTTSSAEPEPQNPDSVEAPQPVVPQPMPAEFPMPTTSNPKFCRSRPTSSESDDHDDQFFDALEDQPVDEIDVEIEEDEDVFYDAVQFHNDFERDLSALADAFAAHLHIRTPPTARRI